MAQALDVPIALLERRSQLEAAHQHYQSDACPGPTGGGRPAWGGPALCIPLPFGAIFQVMFIGSVLSFRSRCNCGS